MSTAKSKPTRKLARQDRYTKLFAEDDKELLRVCASEGKTPGQLLRELVAQALRARRLRAAGKDESMASVREAQKEVIEEALKPIREALEKDIRMRGIQGAQIQEIFDNTFVAGDVLRDIYAAVFTIDHQIWTEVTLARKRMEYQRRNQPLTDEAIAEMREEGDRYWSERTERRFLEALRKLQGH